VLSEFEGLLTEAAVSMPTVHESYQVVRPRMGKLRELLQSQLLSIEVRKNIGRPTAPALRIEMKQLAAGWATEWQKTVYALSNRLAASDEGPAL
jgi:hypothetical protein